MDSFDKKKRDKLKNILRNLAKSDAIKSEKDICNYLNQLKQIYFFNNEQVFNHCYSDIFPLLIKLKETENNIDSVGVNLNSILKYSKKNKNQEVYKVLKKLWDHTNLEIERINYVDSIDARLDITGKTLEEKYKSLQEKYKNIGAEAEEINEKQANITKTVERVNNIYSEFISILGIFSAIVLVYFGGTSIIGNVLGAINETFIFKGILICLVAGIIIFNIIFMFLYFLAKILNQSISATPYRVGYENILSRFRLRYPIIYYVNILALIAVIVDVVVWILFGQSSNKDLIQAINVLLKGNIDLIQCVYLIRGILIITIIVFNFIFCTRYFIYKMTGQLLGKTITLKYDPKIKLDKNFDSYTLITEWGKLHKVYDSKISARLECMYNNYVLQIKNLFINFNKRLFLRHKVFIWVNIISIILLFIVFNIKI